VSASGGIIREIAALRRARILRQGHDMGAAVPSTRAAPLVRFGADPFLICEVKRRSPSRGGIAPGRDAVEQARLYAGHGVRSVSVLTEQDRFDGSLSDLMAIKNALPSLSVLRKDFLLDEEDVEVSWRAGADAVLLIASLLDGTMLARMHQRAMGLGMSALVELHDADDVEKCRALAPPMVGINCRDLQTFSVDLLDPVGLIPRVSWRPRIVFESGIRSAEDVLLARSAGFDGVLVGETAMRSPGMIPELARALLLQPGRFWARLWARRTPGRPLVKVCGITRAADAAAAHALGADALGFVLAPSRRRAEPSLLRELEGLDAIKVAVVVTGSGASGGDGGSRRLAPEVQELLARGLIDAVQFHGDETPQECASMAFPYFKAMPVRSSEDIDAMRRYACPRVLADAWSAAAAGGTGTRISADLVQKLGRAGPLWLAGGIRPENVGETLDAAGPELIDASSGLEESPGRKDPARLEAFFEEIRKHEKVQ
jgi:indole-3-glycerol phosphate synthase / phosphoribosylanthranilate isomerase